MWAKGRALAQNSGKNARQDGQEGAGQAFEEMFALIEGVTGSPHFCEIPPPPEPYRYPMSTLYSQMVAGLPVQAWQTKYEPRSKTGPDLGYVGALHVKRCCTKSQPSQFAKLGAPGLWSGDENIRTDIRLPKGVDWDSATVCSELWATTTVVRGPTLDDGAIPSVVSTTLLMRLEGLRTGRTEPVSSSSFTGLSGSPNFEIYKGRTCLFSVVFTAVSASIIAYLQRSEISRLDCVFLVIRTRVKH
jgi:hypothetical protein